MAEAKLELKIDEISVVQNSADWLELTKEMLLKKGLVRVIVDAPNLNNVIEDLQCLLAEELEAEYLLLPISIRSVVRNGESYLIDLALKGAFYAV